MSSDINQLGEFYKQKYEPLALSTKSKSTKQVYKCTLRNFDKYLERPATLSDLNKKALAGFAESRLAAGLAEKTVQNDLDVMLALWRWAHKNGFVAQCPSVESRHLPNAKPVEPRKAKPATDNTNVEPKFRELRSIVSEYLAVRNAGGSPSTERLHYQAIARFAETIGHEPKIDDLTDVNLGRHAQVRLAKGVKRDTAAGEQAKLLALWRFLAKRNWIDRWPESKPISRAKRIPKAWTQEEFERLYQATDFAEPVGNVPGFIWWRCLFSCLFFTGERITAMRSVTWDGIDLETGWMEIRGENRKGGLQDRRYRIPAETIALLNKIPRETAGPFKGVIKQATLYLRLRKILKRAGLPDDAKSKFHRIRRTTASYFEANGGDATELLGHSARKVTRGYLDERIVQPTQACDLLFSPTDKTSSVSDIKPTLPGGHSHQVDPPKKSEDEKPGFDGWEFV